MKCHDCKKQEATTLDNLCDKCWHKNKNKKKKQVDKKVKDYLERADNIRRKHLTDDCTFGEFSDNMLLKANIEIAKMIQREEHGTISN